MQYKKHIILSSPKKTKSEDENLNRYDYKKNDDDDIEDLDEAFFKNEVVDYRTGGVEEEKKNKKKRKIFAFYFINIVLFIAILVVLGFILNITVFPIKKISVTNSKINSDEFIKERVIRKGKYEENGLYQIIINLIDKRKNIPFVENYEIKLVAPKNFVIDVKEKELLCYAISKSNNVYFDDNGVIKEISKKKVTGVIKVTGLPVKNHKINDKIKVDEDALNALLNTVKMLKKYNLKVDEVDFYDKNSLSCKIGNIVVDLGSFKYLDKKITRLNSLMPQVKQYKKGKFHFENWSPDYTDIIFEY